MQATTPLSKPNRKTLKCWKKQLYLKFKQQFHYPSPTAGYLNVENNKSILNASNNSIVLAQPRNT